MHTTSRGAEEQRGRGAERSREEQRERAEGQQRSREGRGAEGPRGTVGIAVQKQKCRGCKGGCKGGCKAVCEGFGDSRVLFPTDVDCELGLGPDLF